MRANTASLARSWSKRSASKGEITGVAAEVFLLERLLAVEEASVHLPESLLVRRCLGGGCGGRRVRMNLGQGEVAKGEPESAREPLLGALDLAESAPGVRTLVVPVFDEERSILRTADVVDGEVDCLEG